MKLVPVSAAEKWAAIENNISTDVAQHLPIACQQFVKRAQQRPQLWHVDATKAEAECNNIKTLVDKQSQSVANYLLKNWQLYSVEDELIGASGLFTGYFTIGLEARYQRSEQFTIPILKRPAELVDVRLTDFDPSAPPLVYSGIVKNQRLVPYLSRAEIMKKSDQFAQQAVAWLKSPSDLLFLHIQGSGELLMGDGQRRRVGFEGRNGHPYTALGRVLVERELLTKQDVSMHSIRRVLSAQADGGLSLINNNASYIFMDFRSPNITSGASGLPLMPNRSLAVDARYIPYGAIMWVEIEPQADQQAHHGKKIQQLMFAHDTGAAIQGVVRGDYYFGVGEEAGDLAGTMKRVGRYYLWAPPGVRPVIEKTS